MLQKVVQNNAIFGLSDPVEMHLQRVRMQAGNGRTTEKIKAWSLVVKSAIKTAFSCLATNVNAMSGVNGDHKYKSNIDGYGLKVFQNFLNSSGVNLNNGEVFKKIDQFHNYLPDYSRLLWPIIIYVTRVTYCTTKHTGARRHTMYKCTTVF